MHAAVGEEDRTGASSVTWRADIASEGLQL